jgi:hypothetical protein
VNEVLREAHKFWLENPTLSVSLLANAVLFVWLVRQRYQVWVLRRGLRRLQKTAVSQAHQPTAQQPTGPPKQPMRQRSRWRNPFQRADQGVT